MTAASPLRITRAGADGIERVRSLWLELHHHHRAVGGSTLEPYVDDDVSWSARRAMYRALLERDDASFLLLAELEGALVAYAMVAVSAVEATWVPDTWRTGGRIAEIETLLVTARARGAGVGSVLLDRIDEELAAEDITDVVVGALAANEGAIRLYERRGFRRAMVYLARFDARVG